MKFNLTNKYHSKRSTYNGISYHSKREAMRAAELDFLVRGREIKSWRRQVAVPLEVNGIHICKIVIDFVITERDGSETWEEVKGVWTREGKLKWALFEALYPTYRKRIIK